MIRALLLALLALCPVAAPAAAQWRTLSAADTATVLLVAVSARDVPDPGTRPAQRLRGTLHGIAPDTLYLRAGEDSVVAVPRIRILRVEESLGVSRRESARMLGSSLAFFAGLLLMGVDDLGVEVGWWRAGTIMAGAGLAGGAVGALRPWERWEQAWLPDVSGP